MRAPPRRRQIYRMRKLEHPPRIDLAFQARTDRCLALTRLALDTSRARIEASLRLLRRIDTEPVPRPRPRS
ncbi:hypothetical protein [Methylobacterium nigriterrae]|uniref:hypothetical protein n=1 Tax=Methylobacterium nigriterrae TaxID=3127512 RepID=UPI0030137499